MSKKILSIFIFLFLALSFLYVSDTHRAEAQIIEDGDLIRAQNTPDVYIVKLVGDKKYKRHILNPTIFESYGHLRWEDIKDVPRETVDSFKVSNLVMEVYSDGRPVSGRVYKVSAAPGADYGQKRFLNLTPDQFLNLGYNWSAIYHINHIEASDTFYAKGEDLADVKEDNLEKEKQTEKHSGIELIAIDPTDEFLRIEWRTNEPSESRLFIWPAHEVPGKTYFDSLSRSSLHRVDIDYDKLPKYAFGYEEIDDFAKYISYSYKIEATNNTKFSTENLKIELGDHVGVFDINNLERLFDLNPGHSCEDFYFTAIKTLGCKNYIFYNGLATEEEIKEEEAKQKDSKLFSPIIPL